MSLASYTGSMIAAVLCIGTITVMGAMALAFVGEIIQEARGLRSSTSALHRKIEIGMAIFFLVCASAAAMCLSMVLRNLGA